ncbi:ABC transporter permease [Rhizobium leguminosarum]|uniref:ABC transporter permease n=1 Tax=Rhizobium leguminosarum TaxID=384 RepID=UPI001CDC9C41|nr:ABC transporter permease [Rhizobium leguminosarum]MCA2411278.1 ABC transporter permease [Rhizobium leguminosarum]
MTSGFDAISLPPRPATHPALRRFIRHKLAILGIVCVTVLILASIFGPYILPYDHLYIDLRARFAPPMTGYHSMGTDPLGRDVAARLLMAGRVSLLVAFSAMFISIGIGVSIGIIAGYYGGRIGAVMMRIVDAFLCFPSILLLLTLAAFIRPSPTMITLLIAATSWMEIARIVSAEVKSLKERDFIAAARMAGLSGRWIMTRELLPNVMGPIIVAATLTVARAILSEAYISFLGYGIQPPNPSWGNMLNGAQQYLATAPWLAIIPGMVITLAVTSFNFIGDGLRDALDIRSQD